jgi:2TM domain-containing protein
MAATAGRANGRAQVSLKEYQAAERELVVGDARIGWRIHAALYAVVNAGLALVNLLALPGEVWFVYPLLGWGIGLALHYRQVRFAARSLGERQWRIEQYASTSRAIGAGSRVVEARPGVARRAA